MNNFKSGMLWGVGIALGVFAVTGWIMLLRDLVVFLATH